MKWTNEWHNFLIQLIEIHGNSWQVVADEMTKQFNVLFTYGQVRSRWRHNRHAIDESDPIGEYGQSIKKNADGSIEIDQLIAISKEKLKDESYILDAHGYDPEEWDITSHRFSMWNHHNKVDGTKTLYSSKVTVKPKDKTKLSDDDIKSIMTRETKPLKIDNIAYEITDQRLLGIELMDMHFGMNTIEDYADTIARLTLKIEEKAWEKIVLTFGSDLMHVDNLKNTTANGTRIEDVNIEKMIDDVKAFYEYIVSKASSSANKVKVIYIKGNHDETTSGMMIHWLAARFSNVANVEVDTTIQEVKVYTWEHIFVALTHGEKGGKRTKNSLATNYPIEWANAKIREFHKGHTHHEQVKCEFGITERTLPTGAKTDQYHKDNSFDAAHKRFQIFEYSGKWLESIHYV